MNPMFERDFVGFAEKKRFFILRSVIVGAPAVGLILMAIFTSDYDRNSDSFGELLFTATTYPLLILALFIAPSLLAHSIVVERKLHTIEVLRTTAMTPWKIVWGKWFGRSLLLLIMCVAALPLTASSLLFGGVSPMQILQFSVVLIGSILWATSLPLFISSVSKDVTTASRNSVALVLFGLIGTGVLAAAGAFVLHLLDIKEDYATIILQANPIAVLVMIQEARLSGSIFFTPIHPAWSYGLISVFVTVLFLFLTVRQVTREATKPFLMDAGKNSAKGDAPKKPKRWLMSWLDKNPMAWLEINQGFKKKRLASKIAVVIGLILIEFFFIYAIANEWRWSRTISENAERTWAYHVAACSGFLFLAFLTVISVGASAFRRDSDAKTLEVLYATPMSSRQLANGKIIGVLFSALPAWGMAQLHALLAVAMLATHPIAWVWWVIASTTLVVSAAGYSMWVGLKSKSLVKANIFAMGGFGVWMVAFPIALSIFFAIISLGGGSDGEWMVNIFFGWHPMYTSMAPLLAGGAGSDYMDEFKGWHMTMLYLLVYFGVSLQLILVSIPKMFKTSREGLGWGNLKQ